MPNFEIRRYDNLLLGKRYGKLTIIEPNKYYDVNKNDGNAFLKCRCDCGVVKMVSMTNLINHKTTTSCGHCYDNKYQIINDYVTCLWVFDFIIGCYQGVLINTECVNYIKSFGNWHICHKPDNTVDIRYNRSKKFSLLHRAIVSYINSKYNLPPLLDNQQIDHISGNTFNNLYYPFNDYYNNLRVCNNQQNILNNECRGYKIYKNFLLSDITINGKRYTKSFHTPQECINYNNNLIELLSPNDAKYYYHSPSNPRNWDWTFSNTILNDIGYNDNEYRYMDDDFNI